MSIIDQQERVMTFFRKTAFQILWKATKASAQDTARVSAGSAVVLMGYSLYDRMPSLGNYGFFSSDQEKSIPTFDSASTQPIRASVKGS